MAVGAAALLVFAVDVAVLALRTRAQPVSFDRTVAQYRREASDRGGARAASSAGPAPESGRPAGDPGAGPRASSPATPGSGSGPGADRPAAPEGPSPSEAWRPPAPGVYTFRTEGSARFRIARHDYPSETYAILHAGDGCRWSVRHNLVEEDVDEYSYCTTGESFEWLAWGFSRSFFGVRQRWDYHCRDLRATKADIAAGRGFAIDCATDKGDRAVGTGRFVGVEELTIGGDRAQTYHYAVRLEMEGSFRGVVVTDLWLEAASGLRVRERRSTSGSIPAGPYQEDVNLDLVSLTPAT